MEPLVNEEMKKAILSGVEMLGYSYEKGWRGPKPDQDDAKEILRPGSTSMLYIKLPCPVTDSLANEYKNQIAQELEAKHLKKLPFMAKGDIRDGFILAGFGKKDRWDGFIIWAGSENTGKAAEHTSQTVRNVMQGITGVTAHYNGYNPDKISTIGLVPKECPAELLLPVAPSENPAAHPSIKPPSKSTLGVG